MRGWDQNGSCGHTLEMGVEWTQMVQDRGQWQAVVNTMMNLWVLAPRSCLTVPHLSPSLHLIWKLTYAVETVWLGNLWIIYIVPFSRHKVDEGRLDKMKALRGTVVSFNAVRQDIMESLHLWKWLQPVRPGSVTDTATGICAFNFVPSNAQLFMQFNLIFIEVFTCR
jgi:hypothetical protein